MSACSFRVSTPVYGANDLLQPFGKEVYCKIYVGKGAVPDGTTGNSSIKKMFAIGGRKGPRSRVFRTHSTDAPQLSNPVWNETFRLNIRDPVLESVTIRVKSRGHLHSRSIGSVVVPISQLYPGEQTDSIYPLSTGKGSLRLLLRLLIDVAVPQSLALGISKIMSCENNASASNVSTISSCSQASNPSLCKSPTSGDLENDEAHHQWKYLNQNELQEFRESSLCYQHYIQPYETCEIE